MISLNAFIDYNVFFQTIPLILVRLPEKKIISHSKTGPTFVQYCKIDFVAGSEEEVNDFIPFVRTYRSTQFYCGRNWLRSNFQRPNCLWAELQRPNK